MRNSPPVVAEDKDLFVPNECVEDIDSKVSLFEETAFVPERLLAERALELLLLGLSLVVRERLFANGVADAAPVELPNPGIPVALGDVSLDASLFVVLVAPKISPVEPAFEAGSLASMTLEPDGPPWCVAFETPLLEDVVFEPTRLGDGDLDVLPLGVTPPKLGNMPIADEDLAVPNTLLVEEGWGDAFLIEDAEFESKRRIDDPKLQLMLLGTLLVEEEPKAANSGTPDSFSGSLVPLSPPLSAIVPTIPVIRAADALVMSFVTCIVGCAKGFTDHVCVLNSSSWFLLLVSGSR